MSSICFSLVHWNPVTCPTNDYSTQLGNGGSLCCRRDIRSPWSCDTMRSLEGEESEAHHVLEAIDRDKLPTMQD